MVKHYTFAIPLQGVNSHLSDTTPLHTFTPNYTFMEQA